MNEFGKGMRMRTSTIFVLLIICLIGLIIVVSNSSPSTTTCVYLSEIYENAKLWLGGRICVGRTQTTIGKRLPMRGVGSDNALSNRRACFLLGGKKFDEYLAYVFVGVARQL